MMTYPMWGCSRYAQRCGADAPHCVSLDVAGVKSLAGLGTPLIIINGTLYPAAPDSAIFVNGFLFREGVIERPGLTNFGQPFWGTDIFDRSPVEAAAMAAEKGYVIRWQIEARGGTQSSDDDEITFSEEAPPCGKIGGGSVIEEGRIQLVVILDDPSTPGSEC